MQDDDDLEYEEEDDSKDTLFDDVDNNPPSPEQIFSIEDLKNNKELRTSQVAPWYTNEYLPQLSMTHAYRLALTGWVNTFLTVDELLSDHSQRKVESWTTRLYDPFELSKEQAKLALLKTRLSASKKDTKQAWWGTIEDNLFYAYTVIHNRTQGNARERILQIKKITSTEQSTHVAGQENKEKAKGSFLFGR